MGTFLLCKMTLIVMTVKLLLLFEKTMYWDPMWGISILADLRPMGNKLSCCGSLWSR